MLDFGHSSMKNHTTKDIFDTTNMQTYVCNYCLLLLAIAKILPSPRFIQTNCIIPHPCFAFAKQQKCKLAFIFQKKLIVNYQRVVYFHRKTLHFTRLLYKPHSENFKKNYY